MAKKHKKKHKHRNNGGPRPSAVPTPSRPRRNRGNGRKNKPDLWTLASAVGGGVGGAMLGGWAARKGYDARWVGAGLAGLGGLAAYKLDGNARSASYGLAAAGVGQSVLEWLDKDEEQASNDNKDKDKGKNDKQQAKEDGASQPNANGDGEVTYVSSKPATPSRNSARGLDRAFNRVRDRLQRIYDDDQDDDSFVEEEDAA